MEDVISLTPKQIKGLVFHLNGALWSEEVHSNNDNPIVTEWLLDKVVRFYNNPNIFDSVEEREGEGR